MGKTFKIHGQFKDQQGIVRQGRITGHNGEGTPCRRYTWVKPAIESLKGKHFEAFDDQIEHAKVVK